MSRLKIRNVRAAGTAVCLLLAGCPDAAEQQESHADLGTQTADLGCYARPQTHVELLNACTAAQSLDKRPVLPLLRRDGTLPPLP